MIRTQSRVRVRARVRLRKVKCLVRGECQFGGWNQVTTKKYPYTVPYPDYGPGTRGGGGAAPVPYYSKRRLPFSR